MYKSKNDETPAIFSELSPFGGKLNPRNRWLRLAALLPWQEIEENYRSHYSAVGRPAKDARLVCGLLAVKFLENYSYERAAQEFFENPYVQCLCGFETFVTEQELVSGGLLSRKRREMASSLFDKFEADLLNLLSLDSSLRESFRQAPRSLPSAESFWSRLLSPVKKLFS
ncbi:MAG TPA: transposase [Elusimicrobiales bacterium]|nr:transposase [Elusimicrobiales bacterium]